MARTVEDVALLFGQMVGYDALDTRSVDRLLEDYSASARQSVAQLRVGVPRKPFFEDVDPQITAALERALAVIAKLTRGLKDVSLPSESLSHDTLINAAEVLSYHQKPLERMDLYTPTTRKVMEWCGQYVGDPAQGTSAEKLTSSGILWTASMPTERPLDGMDSMNRTMGLQTMKWGR